MSDDDRAREKRLRQQLAPMADAIADEIKRLDARLRELDLTSKDDRGVPRWHVDAGTGAWHAGIEADHPEDGKRLYGFDAASGAGDVIVCTRVRADGRYEHAMLDADGWPIEWGLAPRPEFN